MKAFVHEFEALQNVTALLGEVLAQLREVLHALLAQELAELRLEVGQAVALERLEQPEVVARELKARAEVGRLCRELVAELVERGRDADLHVLHASDELRDFVIDFTRDHVDEVVERVEADLAEPCAEAVAESLAHAVGERRDLRAPAWFGVCRRFLTAVSAPSAVLRSAFASESFSSTAAI